jgi:hypothetical protein
VTTPVLVSASEATTARNGQTNQYIVVTKHRSSDLGAALTGLVVGVTVLFAIVFAIVKMTNASYAAGEGAAPAAQTSGAH